MVLIGHRLVAQLPSRLINPAVTVLQRTSQSPQPPLVLRLTCHRQAEVSACASIPSLIHSSCSAKSAFTGATGVQCPPIPPPAANFQRPFVRGSRYRAAPVLEPRLRWPAFPCISEAFWAQDGKASETAQQLAMPTTSFGSPFHGCPRISGAGYRGVARIAVHAMAPVNCPLDLSSTLVSPLRVIAFICH